MSTSEGPMAILLGITLLLLGITQGGQEFIFGMEKSAV